MSISNAAKAAARRDRVLLDHLHTATALLTKARDLFEIRATLKDMDAVTEIKLARLRAGAAARLRMALDTEDRHVSDS